MTQRWFCKHKEHIAPNAFWMRLRRHCLHASHYAEQQGGMCHHTWLKRRYIQIKCNYGMVSKSVQSGNTFKATLRSGSSHTRKTPNLVRSNDSWKPKVPLTCYYCYIPCYPTPTVPANWGGCKYFFKTKKNSLHLLLRRRWPLADTPLAARVCLAMGMLKKNAPTTSSASHFESTRLTRYHGKHLTILLEANSSPGHQFCPFSIAKGALISRWATTRAVWRWTWSGRRLGNQNRGTGINRHVCRRTQFPTVGFEWTMARPRSIGLKWQRKVTFSIAIWRPTWLCQYLETENTKPWGKKTKNLNCPLSTTAPGVGLSVM